MHGIAPYWVARSRFRGVHIGISATANQGTPVHTGHARKPDTEAKGVRLPLVTWRLLEAVRDQDRDDSTNTTIRKAVDAYIADRLRKAA